MIDPRASARARSATAEAFDVWYLSDVGTGGGGVRLRDLNAYTATTSSIEQIAIRRLSWFVRLLWEVVEPGTPLVWNWHLDAVCFELERVMHGEVVDVVETAEGLVVRRAFTSDLVINIPPGHMKSLIVSVFFPAWQWIHRPELRSLYVANSDSLVKRDSRRTRDLIRSERYQRLVLRHMRALWRRLRRPSHVRTVPASGTCDPPTEGCPSPAYRRMLRDVASVDEIESWGFRVDQGEVANFGNTTSGYRQCKPIGGKITGERADGLVIDDPYDVKEVVLGNASRQSERMQEVVDVYDHVLSSRLNNKGARRQDGTGGYYRILIMQRIHEDDLAGVLLRRGYRHVVIPTEFDPEPDHYNVHPLDPRTVKGALLFAKLFSAETVEEIRIVELGDRHYRSQHGQDPAPATGGTFASSWFVSRYTTHPQSLHFDEWAITVDADFGSDAEGSSYVVLQVWGRRGTTGFYLLDQVRERMNFPTTKDAIKRLRAKWSRVTLVLIEKKANGAALIDTLRDEIPFVLAFVPRGSKEARANVSSLAYAAGNVNLPSDEFAPFMGGPYGFVDEHLKFPGGRYDDQVDAESQILIHWTVGHTRDALARTKRTFAGWIAG